jgi:hypothetical protein
MKPIPKLRSTAHGIKSNGNRDTTAWCRSERLVISKMRPKRPRATYVTAMVLLNALTAIVAVEATLDDAVEPWLSINFPLVRAQRGGFF